MAPVSFSLSKTIVFNKRNQAFRDKRIEINKQKSNNNNSIFKPSYNKFFQPIAQYLMTLQNLFGMTAKKYQKFKNHALYF